MQEKMTILDEQIQEGDVRKNEKIGNLKSEFEKMLDDYKKTERREKELDKRVEVLEKQNASVPGRTVSLGPNQNDLSVIRSQIRALEEENSKLKLDIEKRPEPKLPDSTISPAVASLNDKFINLETSVDSLRTEVESDRNRFENLRHENSNKFRSIREELKKIQCRRYQSL